MFSYILGPEGRVHSFLPVGVADFKTDPVGHMRVLAQDLGRDNVEAVSADLVAMPEVTSPSDVVWMHLFYHDLHTKLILARGGTAADFNRAVYGLLKPGGIYVIVDHGAAARSGILNIGGSNQNSVKTLCPAHNILIVCQSDTGGFLSRDTR